MSQPNKLRFLIGEEVLKNSPDGWRNYGASWKRSNDYFGINRVVTLPVSFVKDGAKLLREAFNSGGYEANTDVTIYENNPKNWEYELNFEGEIDYSTLEDSGDKVSVNIFEGGLAKYLDANKDNVYEIEIGDEYNVDVPRGISIIDSANMILQPVYGIRQSTIIMPWTVVKQTNGENFIVTTYEGDNTSGAFTKNDNEPLNISFYFAFKFTVAPRSEFEAVDGNFSISCVNLDGSAEFVTIHTERFDIKYPDSTIVLKKTVNFTLVTAGKYRLQFGAVEFDGTLHPYQVLMSVDPINTDGTPDFKFSFTGSTNSFSFKALPLRELFEQLVNKMTEGRYTTNSKLLTTGEGAMLFATSGDGIRGFSDAKVKISFSDFFQSVNTVLNVGMGIEDNVAVLEEKAYFFDAEKMIADLGEVSEMTTIVDKELLFNKLNVGYKAQEYGTQLGRDEFNIQLNYEAPVIRSNATFDLTSPMRADSYGVFYTRLKFVKDADETTDGTTDNDPFIVHLANSTSGYIVDQSILITGGSLNPEGVFNVFLSPKRCLLRHQNVLASALWKVNGDLQFISSERQDSNLQAETITEKDNIPISSLQNPLYVPILVRIRVNVPKKITDLLRINSKGYFAFSFRGIEYKGFVVNVSNVLAMNEVQEWTLRLIEF